MASDPITAMQEKLSPDTYRAIWWKDLYQTYPDVNGVKDIEYVFSH